MAQTYTTRGGAPQTIDLQKLPAGHMKFTGGSSQLGLYIAHGHPYNLKGELMQPDVAQLQKDGYVVNPTIIQALAQHQPKIAEQKKHCIACSMELPLNGKFCGECGAAQTAPEIWTPGSDDEGDRLAKLIDPSDPFGSLAALDAPPPAPRKSPEEIFAELQRNEDREASKDLKVAGGLAGLTPTFSFRPIPGGDASDIVQGKRVSKPK